jgi:enoyl-CoA hydratase/carnithine racemase
MISAGKIRANRANSRHSTGPTTAAGRSKSAGNARRHGLRIPVLSDPTLSAEVEAMAQKIAGNATPELIELARQVAEAEVDVLRVRRFRSDMISRELKMERFEVLFGGS